MSGAGWVYLMPWRPDRYPNSMRHLPEPVRYKAIEIANALLDEGMEEGRAIRIAIAKARQWVQRHDSEADVPDWMRWG